MVERYFPLEEYEARWARVEDEMKKKGLDAAIVWSRSAGSFDGCADALYLTNFYSTNSGTQPDSTKHHAIGFNAVLLQVGEEPELICDEPPPDHLIATTRHRWSLNVVQAAMDAVRERNIGGKVAFCGTELFPMKYWAELQKGLPNIDWQFDDHLTETARMIKSPRELDCFREGGEIVTEALNLLNNVYGAMHPEIAQCLRMLARLNYIMGDHVEAMSCQQKAVLMSERVNGIDHPYTITEYTHLALYCFANTQVSTALKLLYR